MTASQRISGLLASLVGLLGFSCLPMHDLDSAASGKGDSGAGGATVSGAGGSTATGGSTVPDEIDAANPGGTGGSVGRDAHEIDAPATGTGDVGAGGATGLGGRVGTGGAPVGRDATGAGGVSGPGGSSGNAADLPDIDDSPVQGEVTFSAGASWDIDGEQWPAFEIHTPMASYWLVKADAAIVSITDSAQIQWINFSSGFRPNRGVPNLGGCCQPGNPTKLGLPVMTTEVDPSFTVTSSHLRLVSKSDDASYWLVWDFFLTHVTVTINRSAKPFGLTYRGLPGGDKLAAAELVVSGGTTRAATNPFTTVLPGAAGWAYITHPATNHALFMIQHAEDTLSDVYRVADGDTAMFTFGGGQIADTPMRFSLGIMDSTADTDVSGRIAFVTKVIPPR
jgi:hypothetical protein